MHEVLADLRRSLGSSVVSRFDKVVACILIMSEDAVLLLEGRYTGCSLSINKAIAVSLARQILDRAELEDAIEILDLILEALEKNQLLEVREKKVIIGKTFPNQLVTLSDQVEPDVIKNVNAALRMLESKQSWSDDALAGLAIILLISRCAVVTRASFRAALKAFLHPVQAVNNWWWLDLYHKQVNGVPLELRRVFLPVEVASYLIRFHSRIKSAIEVKNGSENEIVDRFIKSFQMEFDFNKIYSTKEIVTAYRHSYLLKIPTFLYGYASRDVESHSLSAPQWLRMNGVAPTSDDDHESQGAAYADLIIASQERPFDDRPLRPLLEICEDSIRLSQYIVDSQGAFYWLAQWVAQVRAISLRKQLLRLVYPWVADSLDQLKNPLDLKIAESIREVVLTVAASDGLATLELCSDFWDFLISKLDTGPVADRQKGVRPNAISPAERRYLTEFVNSGQTRILDETLRLTVLIFIELAAAVGGRRAEMLFLRGKDLQGYDSCSIIIEEHSARSLKTSASTRIVPSVFVPFSLAKKAIEFGKAQDPDDILLRQQRVLGLKSDETIYARANEILNRLFGKGFTLHHLRHTLATWLAVQLNSEILDLKDFRGRCGIIDDLLDSAPDVLTLLGENGLSRRAIWAVAALLGHVDPRVTMKSYIHSLDWMVFFAIQSWKENGYVDELSALTGIPYDTVKKHFYNCPPDGYSLLRRIENEFPCGVIRFTPEVKDVSFSTEILSVSSLRDVEHESRLASESSVRAFWPTLKGPMAEAEAESFCYLFSVGLKDNPVATQAALDLMITKIHPNGFIALSPGTERKTFREGMMACGITLDQLELATERGGKFTDFHPLNHWSALTRTTANAWIRFAPLAGKSRSSKALHWVLHWAPLLLDPQ